MAKEKNLNTKKESEYVEIAQHRKQTEANLNYDPFIPGETYPKSRKDYAYTSKRYEQTEFWTDLQLQKREDETNPQYLQRLIELHKGEVELIRALEEEERLDRYRATHDIAKKVLFGEEVSSEEEGRLISIIRELSRKIRSYQLKSPQLFKRIRVKENIREHFPERI